MRVLLSAFEPYDVWKTNSSWEALVSFLSQHGANPNIITRRYPVDLKKLQSRLGLDLSSGVDAVLHLGQSPGTSQIQLEAIALNVAGVEPLLSEEFGPIVASGPVAYRTHYPIGRWSSDLKSAGIPATVSYHAGTYLCNAAMYLSHHWFARRHETPLVGFIHLPLTSDQAIGDYKGLPSMSTSVSSQAIGYIVDQIVGLPKTLQNKLA